jgi:hypothetical protein
VDQLYLGPAGNHASTFGNRQNRVIEPILLYVLFKANESIINSFYFCKCYLCLVVILKKFELLVRH